MYNSYRWNKLKNHKIKNLAADRKPKYGISVLVLLSYLAHLGIEAPEPEDCFEAGRARNYNGRVAHTQWESSSYSMGE